MLDSSSRTSLRKGRIKLAIITTTEQFEAVFGHQTKEEYIANLEADLELFKARGLEKSVAVISAELDRMKASN